MGAGIAQLAVMHGVTVHLIDVSSEVVAQSVVVIQKRLDRLVQKDRITADQRDQMAARIKPSAWFVNLGHVELAIEAVAERIDVKHAVFRALEKATGQGAVLATNTSSISVGEISQAISDPSRVVGMHFFNPAPLMPLVEVIAHDTSSTRAVEVALGAARAWDKTPVRVKDTPGFIVNRVARGFYLEALRLVGEGVAGVDQIDSLMRDGGGFRMGPFELMDLVGLDVNYAVSTSVWQQMDRHPRFTPHDIQRDLVDKGHLGRKTKRGFYDYSQDKPVPSLICNIEPFEPSSEQLSEAVREFCAKAGLTDTDPQKQYIFARILVAVINEAGLARDADIASAEDIDTAMRKGTNYPIGPIAWGNKIGHDVVQTLLLALNETSGDARFTRARWFNN